MRDDLCRLGAAHRGRSLPARTAFLGGPGAGKTTALCRWLHREVVRHGRLGVVWWMESDAGPVSPALSACCEQLRIPLVRHGSEASPAGGDFVYVDPPPISADPEANARVRDFLEREEITGRVLVLNAAYADKSLLAACKAGRALGATHVVLTHLDEVSCWPGLWEVLLGEGLAPLFLTASAGWAPGITENVIEAMLERTLPAS
jgi:flagellar biosynthesis protein FlhF